MKPFFRLLITGVLVGGGLAACGSKVVTASASVTGTVQGTKIDVASEFASLLQGVTNPVCVSVADGGQHCTVTDEPGGAAYIFITNRATATCSALVGALTSKDEGLNYANLNVLALLVGNSKGNVSPGSYPIIAAGNPTVGAGAQLTSQNAMCERQVSLTATEGNVTLTTVNESTIAGSYTVTFQNQGTLSGSFDIPTCALPDAGPLSADAAPPVCQP